MKPKTFLIIFSKAIELYETIIPMNPRFASAYCKLTFAPTSNRNFAILKAVVVVSTFDDTPATAIFIFLWSNVY